jgi:signal transduction histidine kinase
MDHFQRLKHTIRNYLLLIFGLQTLLVAAVVWAGLNANLSSQLILGIVILTLAASGLFAAIIATKYALEPLKFVWQAVMHISSDYESVAAPNLDTLKIGHDLVNSLVLQIYQFASHKDGKDQIDHRKEIVQAVNVVKHLPLPLFVFNKEQLVTNASLAALDYCKLESSKLFGKKLFEQVNFEFPSEHTLEQWITECQGKKVTDKAYWERVRVQLPDADKPRQCDMAAYYNRDNPSGTEFIVTLFDRTEQYNQDDSSMSFVALAVHELRTPLTVLRGYIEVFEDELGEKLDPELTDFMHKMQLSARQLTAFVNNILNVARIEENQLILHLSEQNWPEIIEGAGSDMQQRAQIFGITIEYDIEPKLPTVAADKVSVYEVIYNLLDNAIKYSGESKRIVISSKLNQDGMVETSVQDFGAGIATSVLPNLFEKFYRNHRTKSQIAGTGLGLFLCKALVTAHGGNIWVQSIEGKGTTLTFTLQPYAQLADEMKTGDNTPMVRTTHGWIKNHSMYRR